MINEKLSNLIKDIVDRRFNITIGFDKNYNRYGKVKYTFYYFKRNNFVSERKMVYMNDLIESIRFDFVRMPMYGYWTSY